MRPAPKGAPLSNLEHELVEDLAVLQPGDLIQRPGRKTWCVYMGSEAMGPDGIRVRRGPQRLALEVTVSVEAMARAAHDERPAEGAVAWNLFEDMLVVLPLPLKRMREPADFLRRATPCRLTLTLLAWHTRDEAIEAARRGWNLEGELRDALRETARGP